MLGLRTTEAEKKANWGIRRRSEAKKKNHSKAIRLSSPSCGQFPQSNFPEISPR